MLNTTALRLLGFALGASLHVFLVVALLRTRRRTLPAYVALAYFLSAGVWQVYNAGDRLAQANVIPTIPGLLSLLGIAAWAGLALAPSCLLHFGLVWARFSWRWAAPAYALVPAVFCTLWMGLWQIYGLWLCVLLCWSGALCFVAASRSTDDTPRRFLRAFGISLLAVVAALVGPGPQSASVVFASLAPPAVFARFAYRYNLLGVLIPRRLVFALQMGALVAVYLLVVRKLADVVADRYMVLGPLTEVALILAAALVWLPLYRWMNRYLTRRTQLYVDFSKRLIEEAARILDLEKRLQFIAQEVGRSFALRKVCLATAGQPPLCGMFGPAGGNGVPPEMARIAQLLRESRLDLVNTGLSGETELEGLIASLGFNYLFPLWYEDRLEGALFLDSRPQLFLDENEPVLLGLSRQISHSIESCRVVEEKIGLERALVRQEHLASLGKVAATIAHEIKNPLSSVKTLAQLMREDPQVRERYDRDLAYMIGETDRLDRSVRQLLSFSRPLPEQWEEVDLSDLLRGTAELLDRQYAQDGIRVVYAAPAALKLARSSSEALKQIVLNLALNAVQASEAGSVVRLEAGTGADDLAFFSVTDHGPGIPAGMREKIFEPFFTTKQRGTGLGLAIVRKNVRHLGGEIELESPVEEGRGTRVTVTLPVQ